MLVSISGGGGKAPGSGVSVHGTSGSVFRLVAPTIRSSLASTVVFPGQPKRLPFPSLGQAAVGIDGVGVVGASRHEHPVPIASVTKVMTAIVVLHDHPLQGGAGGPVFTMTKADHQAWIVASENDNSNIEVVAGEKIDERQLLEALLIPSADNVADYLARWDAGSVAAFVAKMNAEAARLGLHQTHYADASGVNPGSRSTAYDQVLLGGYAMRDPTIRAIVQHAYVTLPTSGRVWNYNPVVGVDGIVGLKSGFTQAASGCLVTAAWRTVGGHRVVVVSAALGQTLGLWQAAKADQAMLDAVSSELRSQTLLPAGSVLGSADATWAHQTVAVVLDPSSGGLDLVGWPGLVESVSLQPEAGSRSTLAHGWSAGDAVASLQVTRGGSVVASASGVIEHKLPPPPPGWSPGSG